MIVLPLFDHKITYYKTICALIEKAEKLKDKELVAKYIKEKHCIERLFLLAQTFRLDVFQAGLFLGDVF